MELISDQRDTYFASALRCPQEEIEQQVELISQNPVINGLLDAVSGFLAVLNENRQIIAVNEKLMEVLGVENTHKIFGLRPGEALNCEHCDEMPGGCGTSRSCATCGAVIAIVSSLAKDEPVERICALRTKEMPNPTDIYLSVRSQPFEYEGQRFVLLFLQDVSKQQQWATLERIFFHDINNILTGLVGASELLTMYEKSNDSKLLKGIHQLSVRLAQEIKIQQALSKMDAHSYQSVSREINSTSIISELKNMFLNHPAANARHVHFEENELQIKFKVDECVLVRVLANMITNALEATEPGGTVKVWMEQEQDTITFSVWNEKFIPPEVSSRIFQKNFSTKGEFGRGLGTYSIKLFGESILGGKVGFTTNENEGTTFHLKLPA